MPSDSPRQKQVWTKPRLTILPRLHLGEAVLASCKGNSTSYSENFITVGITKVADVNRHAAQSLGLGAGVGPLSLKKAGILKADRPDKSRKPYTKPELKQILLD